MTRKQRRMTFVLGGMTVLAVAVGLVLSAFQDNLVFFHSPTEVQEKGVPPDRRFSVGGLVVEDSVRQSGLSTSFEVTDTVHSVRITYEGILPTLVREGQGIVAVGKLNGDGVFVAQEVLAKHDENYMPPEVAESLKEAGVWKGGQ